MIFAALLDGPGDAVHTERRQQLCDLPCGGTRSATRPQRAEAARVGLPHLTTVWKPFGHTYAVACLFVNKQLTTPDPVSGSGLIAG